MLAMPWPIIHAYVLELKSFFGLKVFVNWLNLAQLSHGPKMLPTKTHSIPTSLVAMVAEYSPFQRIPAWRSHGFFAFVYCCLQFSSTRGWPCKAHGLSYLYRSLFEFICMLIKYILLRWIKLNWTFANFSRCLSLI